MRKYHQIDVYIYQREHAKELNFISYQYHDILERAVDVTETPFNIFTNRANPYQAALVITYASGFFLDYVKAA